MMTMVPERYNASSVLFHNVEAGRDGKVAIYADDEEVTYGELARRANRAASALKRLGLRREERVLLVLDDTPAFPAVFFGAIRLGAVPVPVNTLLKPDDYRFFVEDSYARIIVVDAPHLANIQQALAGMAEPPLIIVANGPRGGVQPGGVLPGDVPPGDGRGGNHLSGGVLSLEDVLTAGDDDMPAADTHRDDPAFWLYSSGSTGRPKGVVHAQSAMLYTCETYAKHVLHITEDDVTFSASKLFHAYGLGNNMSFPYWAGAATVLHRGRPTPDAVFRMVAARRPTLFFAVPTLYNAMLNAPGAEKAHWSSVRLCISAAEPLPPDVWHRWKGTFGLTILDGIGSTEMLHIFISNTEDAVKPGTTGKPVPGYEAKIVDGDGRRLGPGEAGDLWVRGGSAPLYYWHHREKTAATIVGDWVRTGDRYRMDEDGFYIFEGRTDDMIKVGGLWVSPIEIENTLMEHGKVAEAAVVGVRVDGFMQIKAWVTVRDGVTPSPELAEELRQWCKERLQRYQYPRFIEFVPQLPKTVTGKIQRFLLRDSA